ncbi:MAG: hypothetical protein M2R45_01060 [Verrucomicrobia subdivision 3 bacterium]|nr:hypothetical protein [Limisphaerales bacterium]MCS1414172.1 hypothetical protein [Limisphaerales bacterium]
MSLRVQEPHQYFIFLKSKKKIAEQTAALAICAIKIFWEKTL